MESTEYQNVACSNCNKPFPQDRIDLHEAYCRRNIKKCPQCGLFVDVHDLISHQEEFHNKKPCNHCKIQLIPEQLKIHLAQCPRRPRACSYCQTEILALDLNTHQAVCGARTRVCTTCNQPIMLKDFIIHQTRCKQHPPQPSNRPPTIPIVPSNRRQRSNQRRNNLNERQRDRDISGNNIRQNHIGGGGQRSLSNNNKQVPIRNHKVKYHCVIPAQDSKPMVQILPISIQLAISNSKRQVRQPFTTKNTLS